MSASDPRVRQVRGPVNFDASPGVILAWCRECPPWRRLAGSRPEAIRKAATHVANVHGDHDLANYLRKLAAAPSKWQ